MYSTKIVDTVSVKQDIQLNKLFIVQSDNVLDQELLSAVTWQWWRVAGCDRTKYTLSFHCKQVTRFSLYWKLRIM